MGVITDILTGVPLNAVLRERLVDKESYIAALESENAVLKAENTVLKAKNAESEAKLKKIENDKAIHGDICPYCQ
jgi:cell division protein FtsB